MSFDRLAEVCDEVAASPGRNRKIELVAEFLAGLEEADLVRATRFLLGQPLEGSASRPALGHAAMRDAVAEATGWDRDLLRLCYREVGDTAETIALLLEGATRGEPLSLAEADQQYLRLFALRRTADRVEQLTKLFLSYRPRTLKYFLKVITGSFRIGLQTKLVEEAVAKATGQKAETVREAMNRSGDLAAVARAAQRGDLAAVEARLFHPMEFMLAKPVEAAPEITEAGEWMVEDKYDGIRAQVHVAPGRVEIYTRSLEVATHSFPDVAARFANVGTGLALDGEILAWRDGRALNFTVLQQRLQRKRVDLFLTDEIPVVFVAYDLLYAQGRVLEGESLEERREMLERMLAGLDPGVMISPQRALREVSAIEEEFAAARERGHEGLVLKRRGSRYQGGKRGGDWLKVKKAFATLDVVVTAAEQGHGKRATMLSDYTFAVRDGDRLLNVGKAYSGLTDAEIRELTRLFRSLAREKYGRTLLVEPRVVLEVAFDGIQKSPRHKSGYALRFPRILRWRQDKDATEIDTLEEVTALYESSLRA